MMRDRALACGAIKAETRPPKSDDDCEEEQRAGSNVPEDAKKKVQGMNERRVSALSCMNQVSALSCMNQVSALSCMNQVSALSCMTRDK
jgi:hypothetical protein